MSKEKNFVKKPLFYGGIAYIVLIFVSLISGSLDFFMPDYSLFFVSIVYLVGYFFAYNAFFVLGKIYKNKLLVVLSVVAMVFSVVFSLGMLASPYVFSDYFNDLNSSIYTFNDSINSLDDNNYTEQQIEEMSFQIFSDFLYQFLPIIFLILVFLVLLFIYVILFGVSLIKLGKKVKYAKVAGILNIVGICTAIFFVGLLVLFVASILEIMILFNEAKKFKEMS